MIRHKHNILINSNTALLCNKSKRDEEGETCHQTGRRRRLEFENKQESDGGPLPLTAGAPGGGSC